MLFGAYLSQANMRIKELAFGGRGRGGRGGRGPFQGDRGPGGRGGDSFGGGRPSFNTGSEVLVPQCAVRALIFRVRASIQSTALLSHAPQQDPPAKRSRLQSAVVLPEGMEVISRYALRRSCAGQKVLSGRR